MKVVVAGVVDTVAMEVTEDTEDTEDTEVATEDGAVKVDMDGADNKEENRKKFKKFFLIFFAGWTQCYKNQIGCIK